MRVPLAPWETSRQFNCAPSAFPLLLLRYTLGHNIYLTHGFVVRFSLRGGVSASGLELNWLQQSLSHSLGLLYVYCFITDDMYISARSSGQFFLASWFSRNIVIMEDSCLRPSLSFLVRKFLKCEIPRLGRMSGGTFSGIRPIRCFSYRRDTAIANRYCTATFVFV